MRFNPLLDEFPTKYGEYDINSDFRVGIMIHKVFNDSKLTDNEKKESALCLLYPSVPANLHEAWDGLTWFMKIGYNKSVNSVSLSDSTEGQLTDSEGKELIFDTKEDMVQDDTLDFDFDSSRIYTAFLRTYGIDLSRVKMHFFMFMFLLADVENDCLYSKVVDIRKTSLAGKKGKERSTYIKLKKLYEVPTEISEESKQKLAEVGIDDSDLEQFMQF